MRDLTFALTKGRLAEKTFSLLSQCGIHCENLSEDSRKLVFVDPENHVRFFMAKAADVPTYVEQGAADIGIVGKDVLLEEQKDLYEVLDLGFGKCRMAVGRIPGGEETAESARGLSGWQQIPGDCPEIFSESASAAPDSETEWIRRTSADCGTGGCDR